MLELDVRLSKDLVPIVMHDSTLHRVTGGRPGTVGSRTASHLTKLELGPGMRILTLHEALSELVPQVPVNVELKFNRPDYRPLVNAVCDVIETLDVAPRILISSFYHSALEVVEKRLPDVEVAPLFGSLTGLPHEDDLVKVFTRPLGRRGANEVPIPGRAAVVSWKMIDKALVGRFEEGGGTLLTYTVDAPAEMVRLIRLGIDGIITNRPALLVKMIEEIF